MKKVYEKIDYKKICKRCHQIHRYELIQTGSTEDFVSKKCPVCGALHKKDGELYMEKIKGKDEKVVSDLLFGCAGCGAALLGGLRWG